MPSRIHATAIVEDGAVVPASVRIGPYSVVGPDVVLGEDVILSNHVTIRGATRLGAGVRVYPGAILGEPPQIYGDETEPGRLEIGAGTVLREHVTASVGSPRQDRVTRIGQDCMLMVGAHVGHDCTVGDQVIMANSATLGGHVAIGAQVFVGGLSAVHQRVRIGDHAFIGGMTGVEQDVIPYGMVTGDRGRLGGLNVVGLKRRGFDPATVRRLRVAYRALFFGDDAWAERLARLRDACRDDPPVRAMVDFIDAGSQRGILKPRQGADDDG